MILQDPARVFKYNIRLVTFEHHINKKMCIRDRVHCAANVEEPVQQGMWGMFEVFADTMVVCTLTALVVLASGLGDLDTGCLLYTSRCV